MTNPQGARQFTEKQVSVLLKRAAELQNAAGDASATSDPAAGLSLAQLQQAAAELGIQPEFLAAAAAEMEEGRRPGSRASIWGGPSVIEIERTVDGLVSEEEWPEVLEEIRRATGRLGITTHLGRSFDWHDGRRQMRDLLHVTITPQGERTRIHIFSRYGRGSAFYAVAAGLTVEASVLLFAFHLGALTDVGLIAGLLGGAFTAARTGFSAICRHKARQAQDLMRALETRIARPVAPHTQAMTSSSEAPVEQAVGRKE